VTISDEAERCTPNISASGRRRRVRFGYACSAITIVGLVAGVALRVPWFFRALLFVPAALGAVGFLQARRGTCVSRAAEGTFEHEDFSTTRAPDAEAARSRRAAIIIARDAIAVGALFGGVASATAFVR
jgi:hypothetical protein